MLSPRKDNYMKHIKQGPKECKLATIAMLAGVSLDTVREIVCKSIKVGAWHEVFNQSDTLYFDVINILLIKIHVDGKVLRRNDIIPLLNNEEARSTATTRKYLPDDLLPLSGKGELFMQLITNTAHSVAYENGMIFDPDQDKEYPINKWLELPLIKNRIKYFIL